MSSMFRKGQNTATALGNLVGGLFVAGLIVSVPLGIAFLHDPNKAIENDIKVSEVNTPKVQTTPLNEPNRVELESYIPFEVRYLQPIFYTGLLSSFGLGYLTCSVVADKKESKGNKRKRMGRT